MKSIAAMLMFVLGLFCGACCGPPMPPPAAPIAVKATPAEEALALRDRTVALLDADDTYNCTGVWVGRSTIATARHCVDGVIGEAYHYGVFRDIFPNNDGRAAESEDIKHRHAFLRAYDESHDVALLRAPGAPAHPIAPLAARVEQGQPARVMGHPAGLWWSLSTGSVAALRTLPVDEGGSLIMIVQATPAISPGSSGGGLFDEVGALMGIASATVLGRGNQSLNMFVNVAHLADLMSEASKVDPL